jgi:hypothetical protein
VGLSSFVGLGAKVSSPRAARGRGLDLPDDDDFAGLTPALAAFLRRSSVARRRASRASSSEVWLETARFLDDDCQNVARGENGDILLRHSCIKVCYTIVDLEQVVQCKREGSSQSRLRSHSLGLPFSVKLLVGHVEIRMRCTYIELL